MSRRKQTNQQQPQSSGAEKWLPTIIVAVITTIGLIVVALINRSTAITTAFKPIEYTQTAEALHTFIAMTTQAYLPASTITATSTNITAPTMTPEVIFTPTPTPTLTVENQLVQLIDNYFTCLNIANPGSDRDYEECWNFLSDRPGEIQSNLNKNDYKSYWKKYKLTYSLYYCSIGLQDFVNAEYYLYDRNNLSLPIGNGKAFYLEYSFGLDENGWRIKGADVSTEVSSYCESKPRIEKLTLIP